MQSRVLFFEGLHASDTRSQALRVISATSASAVPRGHTEMKGNANGSVIQRVPFQTATFEIIKTVELKWSPGETQQIL